MADPLRQTVGGGFVRVLTLCATKPPPSALVGSLAAVNANALATYMGHASVMITLDRYGHLMPGNEDEAAALLDRYPSAARPAVSDGGGR